MKKTLIFIATILIASNSFALSPEEQKAFVSNYKKAFEAKDAATLESFLYAKDADPDALDFFKMMITAEVGAKISEINLVPLSPEELKDAAGTKPGLSGGESVMPIKPTMKLVLQIDTSDENGTSNSSSKLLIAEVDGKPVIPVPVAVR